MSLDPSRKPSLEPGRTMQYLAIAWNSAECVALAAGFIAGSIALVGFDSVLEVTSSLAALCRLRLGRRRGSARGGGAGHTPSHRNLLPAPGYLRYLRRYPDTPAQRYASEQSTVGIVLAALSLIVMPTLVHFKRRVASRLGSGALQAEALDDVLVRCRHQSAPG